MMNYRADIDGLRAIAVISVVLFHLGLSGLSGGFVGVDIFFVISGYLITGVLLKDIDADRFSLARFYERRARRILPALFFMLAVMTVLAGMVLVPTMFRIFGASMVAASLSVANFRFWAETGYFDPDSTTMLLLHTWSLGVEEQFYIVFPLILLLLHRYARQYLLTAFKLIALVSFVVSVYQVRVSQESAFFLPLARAWELMVGSLLAAGAVPALKGRAANEILGLAGLALIAWAVCAFDESMLFPGESALVPCLGAALVIHAGAGAPTLAGRFLSLRPIVFVGLISYSLYLWHWPLIALIKSTLFQRDLGWSGTGLLLALIIGISIFSWRFVERPFRRARHGAGIIKPLGTAALGIGSFAALGLAVWAANGFPDRFSPTALRIATTFMEHNPRSEACDSPSIDDLRSGRVCRIGAKGVEPSFAVVGDSFGDMMVPGVDVAAAPRGHAGIVLTHAGCNPLFGIVQTDQEACRPFMDAVADLLRRSTTIKTVIFIGRWTQIASGRRFGLFTKSDTFILDDQSPGVGFQENQAVFQRALQRSADLLRGRNLYYVAFFPEQQVNVPQAAFLQVLVGDDPVQKNEPEVLEALIDDELVQGVRRGVFEERQHFVRKAFDDASRRLGIHVLDVGRRLCDRKRCRATEDGLPLYVDDNHLTRSTAIKLQDLFWPVFPDRDGLADRGKA